VNITVDDTVTGGAPPAAAPVVARNLRRLNVIPGGGSNVVARADVVRRVGGFDVELGILEDWDLWIRLAADGTPAAVVRPLIGYRIHAANSSRNVARMVREVEVIDARYRGPVDRARFTRHLARVSLRAGDRSAAVRLAAAAAVRAASRGDIAYLRTDALEDARVLAEAFVPLPFRRPLRVVDRPTAPPPNAWLLEAMAWLAELHRATACAEPGARGTHGVG
jgi:hypothetical protein